MSIRHRPIWVPSPSLLDFPARQIAVAEIVGDRLDYVRLLERTLGEYDTNELDETG